MDAIFALLTLGGLVTAWALHFLAQKNIKKTQENSKNLKLIRIKKIILLYLDVLEFKLAKLENELNNKTSETNKIFENFEEENRKNFDALENSLLESYILEKNEYNTLYNLVHHFKTSPNIKDKNDIPLLINIKITPLLIKIKNTQDIFLKSLKKPGT